MSAVCRDCEAPATVLIAAIDYCEDCADALIDPIRERVFLQEGFDNLGVPTVPRLDWGP